MKYRAYLLAILVFFVPVFVQAETVLRMGEDISVDENQTVDGDYYVSVGPFGNTSMSGAVAEDMYALGGSVTVNGTIGKDLTIIGGTTQMHASVTDDVRIVAGEVTVAEHIGGDLFVIGGSLQMLSSASVGGDVIFFGGSAEINGKVGGSVLGTSEKIRVDAEVGGNVDVKTATALTLGEKTNVGGFVRYTSVEPLVRAPNAQVAGEISKNEYAEDEAASIETKVRNLLIPIFITLFATLSLYLLFKKELQALVLRIHTVPAKSALFGLSLVILGPIVSLLLMATILGVVIGIMSTALVILAYAVGYSLSGVVLGSYLSKLSTNHARVTLPWIIAGTLTMHVLLLVPVIGIALALFVFTITVGGLAISVYKLLQ